VLIPVDWDEHGSVTALAVATQDEDQYFIDPGEQTEKMFAILQEEVEISGRVRQRKGRKSIVPESYKLMESSARLLERPCSR